VTEQDPKKIGKEEATVGPSPGLMDLDDWDIDEEHPGGGVEQMFGCGAFVEIATGVIDPSVRTRLEQIKESHALLQQFSARELKILLNMKRNASTKSWTLREDLVVLTLSCSNREIAGLLRERNKEAVKKRLQLLKSKGLSKRPREAPSQ
jgi:hypothetical protein